MLAEPVHWDRVAAILAIHFLALGIGAHALDALGSRGEKPWGTIFSRRQLWLAFAGSVGLAYAIGLYYVVRHAPWLGWVAAAEGFFLLAYNLEWFGGRFHTDRWFALAWGGLPVLAGQGAPIVVKADGLAAGKGVVVAMTAAEAHEAIDFMLLDNKLGVTYNEGGARVVIEEFLQGEEASFIVLCDGRNVLALATSQDHKRLLDGDEGPNTGGMGAYSPAPVVTADVHARAMREIILPTIRGMEKDGIPYTGFLYAGLMIDAKGQPKTLEFNCRMGDPETQPILMRLKSDMVDVMTAAVDGKLDQIELQWDRRTALGVVMAAHGYPENPRKGDAITGLPQDADDAVVFHAGTQLKDGVVSVTGGRVLCVTALADSVKQAQQRVYDVARGIHFDGAQYRRDIGYRALKS